MSTLKANKLTTYSGGTISVDKQIEISESTEGGRLHLVNSTSTHAGWLLTKQTTTPRTYLGHQNSSGGGILTGGIANAGVVRNDAGVHIAAGSAATTGLTVTSAGLVGLGTIAPQTELDVNGRLRAIGPGTTPTSGVGLEYGYNTATGYGFLLAYDRGASSLKPLRFQNGAGAWDASGRFSIGTVTPAHPFHLEANPGAAGVPVAWLHNSGNVTGYDGVVISSINNGADAEVLAVRSNNTTYNGGTLHFLVLGDGNVGFNGASSFGTSGVGVLGIANGTAPTTSPANMVQLWAEDVAASSELRVRDEAGNVTTLSPHAISLFTPDPDEPLPYMFAHENRRKGVRQQIDMTGLIRAVERLSGKQFIYTESME